MNRGAIAYLFLVFLVPAAAAAQNLVPNSDLEGKKGKFTSRPWTFINTIDYFIYVSPPPKSDPVDKNQTLRKAHSGKAYLGMRIWGGYREYIQVKLEAPLKAGKKYSFAMYVAVSPYGNSIANSLGAYFSKSAMALGDYTVVNKCRPQVEFHFSRASKDSTDWFRLQGTFTAKGGEKFLSIGHFTGRFRTHFTKKKALKFMFRKEAYYYFDDISLYELDEQGQEITQHPMKKEDVEKIPVDTAKGDQNYLEKEVKINTPVVLKNIYFATGKAELMPESYEELGLLVELLSNDTASRVEVTGHTDNRGNEEENKKLSFERAKAVVKYLVDNGIREERLTFSGMGSEQPITTNDTEEGRQQNRRVEFVIRK
jgi:outer membrane protein OmpA-like peptidoglycan-associated protein